MTRDVTPELKRAMKQLRLGRLLPVLPERLRAARERNIDPEDLLLTIFTDESQRRARQRHALRAKRAGLHPRLVFDSWDRSADVTYDEHVLDELRTLGFVDRHHHVLIVGPVGVGKTMLAHALGHLAIAREKSVHCETADKLFHRLRACRLDGTYEQELRRLSLVDLLIVDDLALRAIDERETADLYELVTARHRTASMIVTSNRDPSEWLDMFADPMHGQALVDRFINNAYDLVIEGKSYRRRQKPRVSRPAA
jgi:DNA replication protein DnaC